MFAQSFLAIFCEFKYASETFKDVLLIIFLLILSKLKRIVFATFSPFLFRNEYPRIGIPLNLIKKEP